MGISTNQQRITFFAGYLADWQCITRTHCDHCFDCWEKRWVGLLLRMTNNSNHWRSLGNRGSVRAAPLLGVPNWVQQGGLHLPVIKWAAAVSSIFLETGFQAAILAQSWLAIWMDIELLRPVDFGHSNRSTDDPTFGLPNCDPSTQKKSTGKSFFQPRASQLLSLPQVLLLPHGYLRFATGFNCRAFATGMGRDQMHASCTGVDGVSFSSIHRKSNRKGKRRVLPSGKHTKSYWKWP